MKLVLIPGLDGTADLFADFMKALKTMSLDGEVECQAIAYPPDRALNYAEHEAYVRQRLPAGDFVLLAESFSGPIGVSIAAAPPPGLKGLILCASFASNPLPLFGPLSRLIAAFPAMKIPPRLFAPCLYAGRATPELRRAHANAMAKVKASTLRARVAAILAVDLSAELRKIVVPLLYLRAQQDRLVPAAALRKIERIRPDMLVEEFDAPHFLLQTEPWRCAAAVLRFIDYPVAGKTEPIEEPDGSIPAESVERVARLTNEELALIDAECLAQASTRWRKVARIVGFSIKKLQQRIPDVPDVFYAQRVKLLVAQGKLESQGNLDYMRFSEVRLPS